MAWHQFASIHATTLGTWKRCANFSTSYADESAYQANLGKAHQKTDAQLEKLLDQQAPKLSTYKFLSRTNFGG